MSQTISGLPAASAALALTLVGIQPAGAAFADVKALVGSSLAVGAGGTLNLVGTPSGQFYQDRGATVHRMADRLFVGAAVLNGATSSRPTGDWLSAMMAAAPFTVGPWPVFAAQTVSMAQFGGIGLMGASRASDAVASAALLGYVPASIGVAASGVNDNLQNPTSANAWGFYGEGIRMPGVNYLPTFAAEFEAVNLGSPGGVGIASSYNPDIGGGTFALWLGSGGGNSTSATATSAITIIPNPATFQNGIVIAANALNGTNGSATDAGIGNAIVLGRNQAIVWNTPDSPGGPGSTGIGFFIRSAVSAQASGMRIEATDGGLFVENGNGNLLLNVPQVAAPNTYIQLLAGSGGQAAGIYAEGAVPGIGIFPAAGGEIITTAPVSSPAGAVPATAGYGFAHININGEDWRLAGFTPAQVGG
ncbi:MAG TPA: hypothetical protein VNE67_09020 [Acetobacteraceae bacterium]|nr:hypothetical protein [Acetobacteraceae bacterium]